MLEIIPNLHPLMVHFPIALISVSAFFHVASLAKRGNSYARYCAILAHGTLWLGALAAIPTVYFGWQAFNSVNHDEAGHAAMLVHRAWALGTAAVLVILAGWDAWRNKVETPPAWWFSSAVIGAWLLVAVTAWYGGELVYRHGLGVLSLPAAEAGHEQKHGQSGTEHSHTGGMVSETAPHGVHEH
jgi:uncharacterized membrane protein